MSIQVFPTVPSPTTTHFIGRPEDILEKIPGKEIRNAVVHFQLQKVQAKCNTPRLTLYGY